LSLIEFKWPKFDGVKWHWFDIVFVAVRTSWFVLALRDLHANPEQIPNYSNLLITTGVIGLVAFWLTACYLVPLVFYFSKKLRPVSPIIEISMFGPLILYLAAEPTAFYLYNLPVFTVGYFLFRKQYAWLYLPTVVFIPVLAGVIYDYPIDMISSEWLDNTIMFIIGVSFRAMITAHIKMKEMVRIIQDQNQTLEVYSKQIERLTIVEERNRIAGELHDTVGHTFTSTILGMEAVYLQMEKTPALARDNLKQLAEYARMGFDDVRRNIHQIAIHEDEKSLVRSLTKISTEFGEYTGTLVSMEIIGEEPQKLSASESIKITLIRCLQEALTNAKRHGHATEITVHLVFRPESISMIIIDNGSGVENIASGFGLTSMNNRITGLNGSLEVSSKTNFGTRVSCVIPMKAG
jgi:signal transduction histidine kinase